MRTALKGIAATLLCLGLLLLCACALPPADTSVDTSAPSPSPTESGQALALMESKLGYSILYPPELYECRTYAESDSLWHDVGVYLSVSLFPDTEWSYIIDGLRLQEDIEMDAEAAVVGAGQYPARTLYYTDGQGNFRQFWVLECGNDILLIEQSYPKDHPDHRSVQQTMLDSLTLNDLVLTD